MSDTSGTSGKTGGSGNSSNSEKSSKSVKRRPVSSLFQRSFLLLDEIGRGAFGFVYRCLNRRNKRLCAVKFNPNPNDMDSMREEYRTIWQVCQPIGHPNIVNLLGSLADDQIVYNIFELASGGDLGTDLENRGYYQEPLAADIMRQVLLGVQYIHNKGFLHRDLKPQNLLVLKPNYFHVKITDFGLAIRRRKQDDNYVQWQHGYAGTEGYISPEILQNSSYDYECDLWSCGVILYEMLCGTVPWNWDDQSPLDGPHTYPLPEWRDLDEAKDLINRLFDRTIKYQMTASDALRHPFVAKGTLHRRLRPDMENAMTKFLGMRRLKKHLARLTSRI